MNKLLKYGKSSTKIGFADSGTNFYDSAIASKSEQINEINTIANGCRWWYEPIFSNESKYLPTSEVMVDTNNPSAVGLTTPPMQSTTSGNLVNALVVGGVAIILFKLFTA
jgi:hypothetical protein